MNVIKNHKIIVVLVVVWVIVSLACGSATPTTKAPENQQPVATSESSSAQEPVATDAPKPTKTPVPTVAPTPVPVGLSRSNPFSSSEVVSAPNWDVQILETKRGEAAWADIKAANMFNEPAPEGMEYLLVKIHAKSTYADSDEHTIGDCDFDVTGDRLIVYSCGFVSVVPPEPVLDGTLYTGGETEGWAAFAVGQGEGNLMLVVNETMNFDATAKRYIAIDEGASIVVPPDLASIAPTDLGQNRNEPAQKTEKVTTDDWEISVLDVIRGAGAWDLIQKANQFNDPAAEGMEYILVKVHVRYIGTDDNYSNIDSIYFKTTGSKGTLYDTPSVVEPEPTLDANLFPGGEYDGWVALQAAIGETGVSLVFEPLFDFGSNQRFIVLEP